jgi:predicted enzyme related to lactoylglutathione lyase
MNKTNPVSYFEIPVHDLNHAEKFYTAVFNFNKKSSMGMLRPCFLLRNLALAFSGALAKGDAYVPTKQGVIIYFKTENMDATLEKMILEGRKISYPKTMNNKLVFEFEDSRGNRIDLNQTIN